jgi:hypothetical protein
MVPLPECHKRREEMVLGCVLIIEGAFAQPMSQRVDREGGLRISISANPTEYSVRCVSHMMNCDDPKETGVEVPPTPVTPEVSGDDCGDDYPPNQCNREIVPVLPLHNSVLAEVGDISWSRLDPRFHEHPDNMRLH